MKKLKYILSGLLILTLVFQSCDDYEKVGQPDFKVTALAQTAKVGDPIEFNVSNAPDFLNFYSGELGHEYKHRNRVKAEGTLLMSFLNSQKWGLGSNATGTFSVWVSTDYDGSGTAKGVNIANWTNISDRFNISTLYDFTFQSSGIVDISDLDDDKPIYFAFKYFSDNVVDRGAEWYFDGFNITMNVEGSPGPLVVANMNAPGFKSVDVQGVVSAWNGAKWYWDTAALIWRMRGNSDKIVNEDWLITNAIDLTGVSPDKGEPLKTYSTSLESFTHTYTKPGIYTVTLVGNNTTIYGNEEKVQEFIITVTE